MKIRSFAHKGLKRFYSEDSAKGVPPDTLDKLRKMFAFLDSMREAEELRALTVWKVHTLTGDRKGHVEFKRDAEPAFDVHYRRPARNLRPEFRGLPLTQKEY
jgi:plasmid maintenance system killer protein